MSLVMPEAKEAIKLWLAAANPGDEIGLGPFSNHGVKAIGECPCGDERRHTGLDSPLW